MLFGLQNDNNTNITSSKLNANHLDLNKAHYNVHITNTNNSSYQPPYQPYTFKRLTRKVLSSKSLLEHILSYIPIESLTQSALVCNNWYLIIKYIVPISLVNLRTLSIGELVYWLPGENQFPKTVLLKLRFSSSKPQFLQILTSVNSNSSSMVSNGHYQMLELSEILFIIEGHWTPLFDQLNAMSMDDDNDLDMDETQFFHYSKCFSIVTSTYMTYDFITFNSETNQSIVSTMRHIIHQNHTKAQNMAIHAKANKKYGDGMNQIQNVPLIFKDTLSALNFEMFVLILSDCKNKIGTELDIDIPAIMTTEANASLLYPMILDENIMFSDWYPWCRAHILNILKDYGYIKQISTNINILDDNQQGNDDQKQPPNTTLNNDAISSDNIEVLYDGKKHNRRQSSLFGLNAFPMDESYNLYSGIRNSDDEDDDIDIYDDDIDDDFDNALMINQQTTSDNTNDNDDDLNNNDNINDPNNVNPNECSIM